MEGNLIEAAPIAISDTALADLQARLALTRWPEKEPVADWSQGAPLAHVRRLCEYWGSSYDWRRCETMLNGWNPQRTTIDGLGIHFFHLRSPEASALPVLMTHGWPGSVIEFHKVVSALTDPGAHGGDPADAVHLVLPSLPGHGFSDIKIDGDTATSLALHHHTHETRDGTANLLDAGYWHDNWVRTSEGWRIKFRRHQSLYTNTFPVISGPNFLKA